MTGTEIALNEPAEQAAADHIAELEQLLAQLPDAPARSTVADRKASYKQALKNFDVDRLLAMQDVMSRVVDVMTRNELPGGQMSHEQAVALMGEYLDERDIEELLAVRKAMIKEAVFSHLDEMGEPDVNGKIPVPELGKKFCREGTGRGTPAVDEHRLQMLLGQRWVQVCVEEVEPARYVPERIEYRFSIEKVLDMARHDPEILEALRSCLVPGAPKTPKMVIRDLTSEELQCFQT